MKTLYKTGDIAFEVEKLGVTVYLFDDNNYMRAYLNEEDCLKALSAFGEALRPVLENGEKCLGKRLEKVKKDLMFYAEHKWNTTEKEKELKWRERQLTAVKKIKENLRGIIDSVAEYFKEGEEGG